MRKTIFLYIPVYSVFVFSGLQGNQQKKEGDPMSKIEGNWEGAIQVPSQPIRMSLAFDGQGGGFFIPVQGITDFPLTSIEFDDPTIHLKCLFKNRG